MAERRPKLLTPEKAWARIAKHAAPLPAAELELADAVGRTVAEVVASPIAVPGFDRSAMDGYALRAADTPGRLRLTGTVAAGSAGGDTLDAGTAQRIYTGGPIPPGADAVERQEVVKTGKDGLVKLATTVARGQHIRRAGEDIAEGALLVEPGMVVTAGTLTAMAAAGLTTLPVHRPARVAILLTGDELVAPGRQLGAGQIHESNSTTLAALARAAGAEVIELGTVADDPTAIANRIQLGLHRADVLLVCGGVSVGDRDHVRPALDAAGVDQLFWGVSIKPGKPLYCGRRGNHWAFGLPGNPLSGVVCFLVFVEPLLRRMHGESGAAERRVRARLTRSVGPSDNRTTYLTATLARRADGSLEATPTAAQGSAMTLALARADGFIIAPDGAGSIRKGAWVDVLPLR